MSCVSLLLYAEEPTKHMHATTLSTSLPCRINLVLFVLFVGVLRGVRNEGDGLCVSGTDLLAGFVELKENTKYGPEMGDTHHENAYSLRHEKRDVRAITHCVRVVWLTSLDMRLMFANAGRSE